MRILAVDDEELMLDMLVGCVREAAPDAEIAEFKRPDEVYEYAVNNRVDVAFLDIQLGTMSGMELAKQLKMLQANINIVFCTAYNEYLLDAISDVRCSGYILKPVTTEQIIRELDNLRNPIEPVSDVSVSVQCFGNFEVFTDGEPVYFEVSKAKELLAYLIDRNGAFCTNDEISAVLWEDGVKHTSYLKKCKKSLADTLKNVKCQDMIINRWGVWQSIKISLAVTTTNGWLERHLESMHIVGNI